MRVQSHFFKVVLLGLAFLAVPLTAQLAPAAPDRGEEAPLLAVEPTSGQCKAQPGQVEQHPVFGPQRVLKQEFSCYYCEACAGQMVNKACCFSPIGHPWCVGSCTSGCDPNGGGSGPDRPTVPPEP